MVQIETTKTQIIFFDPKLRSSDYVVNFISTNNACEMVTLVTSIQNMVQVFVLSIRR